MSDLSSNLAGMKFFSKLDLVKGYHQAPVSPEDVPKTAIITLFGLFEYLRMPFRRQNSGNTFQRLLDRVMQGLPYTFIYINDILIASPTYKQHLLDMEEVLCCLKVSRLVISPSKCEFGKLTVNFLGHVISESGCSPLLEKVSAIQDFPQPETIQQLQEFLGTCNFYRKFVPSFATIALPLTRALAGKPKKFIN